MSDEISNETLVDLHRRMVRIRRFEETAGKMMEDGKITGALHLYVGEEAVASGVMAHLSNQDQITSTHRGHGHLIAKGGEFDRMFAELFGRATGYCKGKGGSMHISNMDLGMLGANGIVGGGPPIAMGAAFSNKFRKTDNVACCFLGMGPVMRALFTKPQTWRASINYRWSLFVKTTATVNTHRRLTTKPSWMSLIVPKVTACPV